ncbi:hypothetical protein LZD49_08465 [Dyadobacter sp. CY261]|uniref:hypothetical protein n=1 Tax=Dyadobacter sp. CY261 TaxID=2907203 RepID=UPI001F29D3A1|nr:hypothetical protein [Dyadobacter sp. CY261]MCF0070503.1 hypothetical protein [Dyadobacter sp. CY261]
MKISKVWFDETNRYLVLDSGHTIGNPLAWFKRLDEDLSLESFFDFKRELHYAKI